jgi:predicted DNA-binding WGR domain protein
LETPAKLGAALTVRFGRIGSNGQIQTKTFPSAAKAAAERDKLIREKAKKGYVEKTCVALKG